jgi:4-hydroxy-3-methylbut-2-enyl diphosphate reductase IspH
MVREPASERTGIRAERFLMIESHKTPLTILLASPRGFCAGGDRAIQIVERAIERYGLPVYVRHEVVHNRTVVVGLEAKRAIFVEELDEVPDDRPVVFSARRKLVFIDATTNRQAAVKAIARHCDALVVIGAANSSNSVHLVEAAAHHGCPKSRLVQRAADMDWNWLTGAGRLGITAGASAPGLLVDELVAACRERFDVAVEEVRTTAESVVFRLPRTLMA